MLLPSLSISHEWIMSRLRLKYDGDATAHFICLEGLEKEGREVGRSQAETKIDTTSLPALSLIRGYYEFNEFGDQVELLGGSCLCRPGNGTSRGTFKSVVQRSYIGRLVYVKGWSRDALLLKFPIKNLGGKYFMGNVEVYAKPQTAEHQTAIGNSNVHFMFICTFSKTLSKHTGTIVLWARK